MPGKPNNFKPVYPSYLNALSNGKLRKAVEEAAGLLKSCSLCPRKCQVNRLKEEVGFCKTGSEARVYSFLAHHGEEPPISGKRGSGAIFFSGCNMACSYCQNFEFSQSQEGRAVTQEGLADFMLQLQSLGCHNINLVTPTHVLPQILGALEIAALGGLKLPLVYNTSGFELAGVIKLLEGIVDIYLPDMRYADDDMAAKYSSAPGYPEFNELAVKEMHRQVGVAQFDAQNIIKRGLIIRHLVLPHGLSGTERIMRFIRDEISQDTYISLMSQYSPYYKASQFKELSGRLCFEEYEEAKDIMHKYGLFNGWTQEAGGLERFAGLNLKGIK